MRQIGRFIPTILRLARHRPRSKERSVSFDHQAIQRNLLNQFTQVRSPTLVANPPSDANVQPHVEVGLQFFTRARETVKHGGNAFPAGGQNLAEPPSSIAFMQKERFLQFPCERYLCLISLLLLRRRREISIEIQAAFVDRYYFLVRRKVTQLRDGGSSAVPAVMGMNPGGCEKLPGIFAGDLHPFLASPHTGAGDDHPPYPSSKSSFNNLLSIRSERAVRQIHPDINNVVRFVHSYSPATVSSGIT